MDISAQNPAELSPDIQKLIKKLLRDMQTSRMAFEEHMHDGLLELQKGLSREKLAWKQTKKEMGADSKGEAD